MSRLPERDTRAARRKEPPLLGWRPEQRDDRRDLPADRDDRPLPRLHQTRPLHQLRLRSQGDLRQRGQHLQKLAGPDRRRRSRQSDRRRTRRRRHQGPLHGRRRRQADPRGRLRRDPAADLPRGQLLHRTRPRQPELAGNGQRRNDPGQPHLDRGPARRDPHRSAVAGPRRPRPACWRASARR